MYKTSANSRKILDLRKSTNDRNFVRKLIKQNTNKNIYIPFEDLEEITWDDINTLLSVEIVKNHSSLKAKFSQGGKWRLEEVKKTIDEWLNEIN